MRAHAHKDDAYTREPWYGTERVSSAIREALFLRYTLAHYIYWLFYVSSQTG
jgi:alpha-glucosidase (family GH31 glycosyl hydrolase)